MKYSLFTLILVLLFSSCKKIVGANQNLDPNSQVTYDFMSTKVGSKWTYGTRAGVNYTRYARGIDSVKNGLRFSYYERQEDTTSSFSPEYFGKNGSFYITLIDLNGNATNYSDYALWKDSSKLGDSWDNVGSVYYPGLGTVALYTHSTVSEYGLTLTYNGNTFQNVVHVHSNLTATALQLPIGTLDAYFTKGFGIIREEANINIASGAYTLQHTDSLLSYHIEP